MKIFRKSYLSTLPLAVFVSVAVLSDRPATAAILSGGFVATVSDSTNHIWDVSLIDDLQIPELEFQDDDGTTVSWSAPFTQNGAGKLAGSGETEMEVFADIYEGLVDATYATKGSITSSKGIARLSVSSAARGQVLIEERMRTLAGTGGVKLTIDSRTETVSGSFTAKASASGYGSITDKGETDYSWEEFITAVGDGSWTLEMDLTNDGIKKMAGTAVVTLSTGMELLFTVKGTYNAKKDSTLLILVADPANKGSSLKVTIDSAGGGILKGKLTGQQVKAVTEIDQD